MPFTARFIEKLQSYRGTRVKKYLPYFGGGFIILLAIANVVVAHRPVPQQEVLAAVDPWEKEVEFWNEVVRLHPTYRDGYVELAQLYLDKDLKEAAKQAITKAIEIDPLSERAITLAQKIEE